MNDRKTIESDFAMAKLTFDRTRLPVSFRSAADEEFGREMCSRNA